MTFIVVPHGGNDLSTRSFEVSYRRLRAGALLLLLAAAIFVAMAASWWYVAAQAARVPGLRSQVEALEAERERVGELAEALMRVERQYEQVRSMLGADQRREEGSIWLPPAGAGRGEEPAEAAGEEAALPTAWPLTQRGFITREHLGRIPGQHPGIDIAVPTGSYIRASGAGTVLEAGEDSVYGKYVRVLHDEGYETMYAHASEIFVHPEAQVERNEVIALSGNTGLSTAPHLHFELRRDGEPIDPLSVVRPPG